MFIFLFLSSILSYSFFFFFNDTATTEIYTLSLHDALPIYFFAVSQFCLEQRRVGNVRHHHHDAVHCVVVVMTDITDARSEEHTSELQSQSNLVCRLLLEKKK